MEEVINLWKHLYGWEWRFFVLTIEPVEMQHQKAIKEKYGAIFVSPIALKKRKDCNFTLCKSMKT